MLPAKLRLTDGTAIRTETAREVAIVYAIAVHSEHEETLDKNHPSRTDWQDAVATLKTQLVTIRRRTHG